MPITPDIVAFPSDVDAPTRARSALGNDLLAAFSSHHGETFLLLKPHLEQFELKAGTVLQSSGAPVTHVYFPTSGAVSCAVTVDEDRQIATHIIGHDGGINIELECGTDRTYFNFMVELSGCALRLRRETWRAALIESPPLCERVVQHLRHQVFRSQKMIACNIAHDVESRLCQWLLRLHDYSGRGVIAMTHQSLARLMSVRRTTVTLIARALHEAGIIQYRRGQIEVLDRYALETAACECYTAPH